MSLKHAHENRAKKFSTAFVLVEDAAPKRIGLWDAKVPIFWTRKVAQQHADERNNNGFHVHVAKIQLVRMDD